MNELALPAADREVQERHGRTGDLPSLRYAIGVVRSKWRLGATVAGIVFAAIAGLGLLIPQGYYCQALLVFNPTSDDLVQPTNEQSSLPPDTSAIDTEVEVLRSPAVAAAVVRKLKLFRDPEFGGSAHAQPTDDVMRRAVSAVESASRIRRVGLTYAVQVGFVASSIEKAKRVADGIVDAYIARKLDEKLAAVTRANRDLGATLGGLRRQALEAESQVERYKSANNLLGANGSASTEEELTTLDRQVLDARAETAEKEARASQAAAQAKSGAGGTDAGAILSSGTIGALRQKEAQASANLSQLETEFRPDYPLVEKANAELQDIRAQIRSETKRIVAGLRAEASVAARKEASLLASREQTEQRLSANNRARVGLLTLQQSADTAKKIYETYLTRASEAAVARSLQRVDATIESRAVLAASSIFSTLRFKLALGAILALLSAIAAILFSEGWVRKIRSWSDVVRSAGLPVAGVLPDIVALADSASPANHLARNPLTAFAESFRTLRAFLMLSASARRARVIAVTSATPGEGKTLVSSCLARTLAAGGARVVLVDCDLRKAATTKLFERPAFGLAEIVTQSASIDRALVYDVENGFWLLSGSATGIKTGDLFGSDRLDEALRALSERFDRIVIDTSPLLGFADARILASKADSVLYVVRWNSTSASTVRAAVDILRQCGANVSGAVLNKVDVKQQARYGFADGSDYYHYYGSAYAQQV